MRAALLAAPPGGRAQVRSLRRPRKCQADCVIIDVSFPFCMCNVSVDLGYRCRARVIAKQEEEQSALLALSAHPPVRCWPYTLTVLLCSSCLPTVLQCTGCSLSHGLSCRTATCLPYCNVPSAPYPAAGQGRRCGQRGRTLALGGQ